MRDKIHQFSADAWKILYFARACLRLAKSGELDCESSLAKSENFMAVQVLFCQVGELDGICFGQVGKHHGGFCFAKLENL